MLLQSFFIKLFVFFVFFITTKNFFIFYGTIATVLFVYVLFSEAKINVWLITILLILSSVFIFRVFFFSNYEDLKELIKIVIFILLLTVKPRVDKYFFFNIAVIFTILNFSLSLLQYLNFDFLNIVESISSIYNADKHISASLSYTVPRALGLSSGPSQQAVLSLLMFSYFTSVYCYSKCRTPLLVIVVAMALFSVIMTQSKTGLIAIPISFCIFYISYLKLMPNKIRFLLVSSIIPIVSLAFISLTYIFIYIPELGRLYESGLNVSSFQSRVHNWEIILHPILALDSAVFYFFGIGRSGLEFFGVNDIPYDSDYIYVLANFGLVGFLCLCFFVLFNLVKPFFSTVGNGKLMFFSLIASFSVVVSFSLNFYIEPRVYILIGILIFVSNDFFSLDKT